jgi:hypothetical protein
MVDKPFAHISQIDGPLAKVGIFEATEPGDQLLDRFVERRFHIDPLFEAKVTYGIPQYRVSHEEDLRFEYFGLPVPQTPPDALLNLQQLPLGRGHRRVESLETLLCLRLTHLPSLHDSLFGTVTQQGMSPGKAGRRHFAQDHRRDSIIGGVHQVLCVFMDLIAG